MKPAYLWGMGLISPQMGVSQGPEARPQEAGPQEQVRNNPQASVAGGFSRVFQEVVQKARQVVQSEPAEMPYTDNAEIHEAVQEAAGRYQLPPKLLYEVIHQESGFKPHVVSPAGAQGLMQLMPGTASTLGVENSFDIRQNVDGGAKYLRQMLDRFGGDVKLALAAYNAGPHRVDQYQGVPPFEETQNYVRSIMGRYEGDAAGGAASRGVASGGVGQLGPARYDLAQAILTQNESLGSRFSQLDLNPLRLRQNQEASENNSPPPPPAPGWQRV